MKQAWINGIEGQGLAQVTLKGTIKQCDGWFIPENTGDAIKLALEDNAIFKGVVVEGSKETVCEFSVILTESTTSSSGDRIYFKALGNPYS